MLRRLLVVSALLRSVLGQHTEAVCNVSSLSWSFNSLNQSPCLVSAYLANPCALNADFDVPAIGPGIHYTPPIVTNLCVCNTVIYSLLSACALCQGGDVDPWTDYTTNCTGTSPDGTYIPTIQTGTAVPKWAYQLVEATNRFNATLAQSVGDTPENFTSPATTTSSASFTSSISPSPTHSNSPSGGSHLGAIVGGAVGGVCGIALIGAVIAYFLIRSKRKNNEAMSIVSAMPATQSVYYSPSAPNQQFVATDPSKSPSLGGSNGYPHSPAANTPPLWQQQQQQQSFQHQQQQAYTNQPALGGQGVFRPYDPDDPSTFPPLV